MAVFVGLDVHRAQITFDALDVDSGEVQTGRVQPANRETFRRFLDRFDGQQLVAAVEAMTGWRFIVEELTRVGAEVHLAEPADTSAKRGPKRRAKTDRLDARLMRELLVERRLPEAWIAPAHILDLRARVRLRKTLVDQRTEWLQRIHAVLFHHGVPTQAGRLGRLEGDHAREQLAHLEPPHAAEQQIAVALAIVEHVNALLRPLDLELERDARRLHGCRALMAHYGIGAKVATAILAELGDPRRFSSSRQAVRCAGLDITVHESDARRRGGHLSRQGSPVLRWAVFEAAQTAARPGSPDHAYYLELKDRLGANRAALTIARKMLRRAHHTLRALGDDALALTHDVPARSALTSISRRGQLPQNASRSAHSALSGPERLSGRTTSLRDTPSTIMSPSPCPGSSTEIRLGARAQTPLRDREVTQAPPG